MILTKEEREREVFKLFATAAGLLPHGSFESRTSPEPDILYTPATGPRLAFELVEVLDQDYSSTIGRRLNTKDACVQHLNSLPATEKAAFVQAFGNADIALAFKPTLSLQRRKNVLPKIFRQLMRLPPGTTGEIATKGGPLGSVLEYLTIHRWRFQGPLFDDPAAVRVGDPTPDAIAGKMAKSYEPLGELNLLAYIDGNPMFPDDVWLPNLDAYLTSLDRSCQFAHVYVFKCKANAIRRAWHRDA